MGKPSRKIPLTSKPSVAKSPRKRKLVEDALVWEGITLRLKYEPGYHCPVEGLNHRAHLEVKVVEPESAPLPITETGYRSLYLCGGVIEECGSPSIYLRNWLDECARDPAWRKALDRWRQLSLFQG